MRDQHRLHLDNGDFTGATADRAPCHEIHMVTIAAYAGGDPASSSAGAGQWKPAKSAHTPGTSNTGP
jgi:hypothetical protein